MLDIVNNLGNLYSAQGWLSDAEARYEQALYFSFSFPFCLLRAQGATVNLYPFGGEVECTRQRLSLHMAGFPRPFSAAKVDHVISCKTTGSHCVSAESRHVVCA